jgi:excisionase family DNA binding protein
MMLTTREAAAVLGLKLRTVQAHITAGNIHAVKMGRDFFITPEEIERFQREKRPAHRPKKVKEP